MTAPAGSCSTSTHWPWIGERTRQLDGAHVALLAQVVNPVACKVGPTMTVAELLALCARLDPLREPGRLTLIARLGTSAVADRLPPLVKAVRAAGHPVIWLVDPMHGNTVTTASGRKTRILTTIVREVTAFQVAVARRRGRRGWRTPRDHPRRRDRVHRRRTQHRAGWTAVHHALRPAAQRSPGIGGGLRLAGGTLDEPG